jgi:hypothetical protein
MGIKGQNHTLDVKNRDKAFDVLEKQGTHLVVVYDLINLSLKDHKRVKVRLKEADSEVVEIKTVVPAFQCQGEGGENRMISHMLLKNIVSGAIKGKGLFY